MYLLTPFILQNFKNSSGQSRVIRMCHFRTQNSPSVMNKIFLVQTIIITFIHLLALCNVQNSKNSYSRSRVMRMCHFWGQNGPFVPSKSFFGKLLISFSSTHQPLSLGKIFNILFQWIQSYGDVQFLGPRWPISPNQDFFQITC